jgi:predicted PhzF superfamily epimerase YddE/YHI9
VAKADNDHLILAAASRQWLADLDYNVDRIAAIMSGCITLQLVFAETPDLFHARNPFPVGGVFEDPATGSAAAAFGGYLRTLELLPDPPSQHSAG